MTGAMITQLVAGVVYGVIALGLILYVALIYQNGRGGLSGIGVVIAIFLVGALTFLGMGIREGSEFDGKPLLGMKEGYIVAWGNTTDDDGNIHIGTLIADDPTETPTFVQFPIEAIRGEIPQNPIGYQLTVVEMDGWEYISIQPPQQ